MTMTFGTPKSQLLHLKNGDTLTCSVSLATKPCYIDEKQKANEYALPTVACYTSKGIIITFI
jgi:hypothetical protein